MQPTFTGKLCSLYCIDILHKDVFTLNLVVTRLPWCQIKQDSNSKIATDLKLIELEFRENAGI